MTKDINPFIISGYADPEYFCDRVAESSRLITELVNGNNVTLFSPRRMGKTSLIEHCFHSKDLERYHTFFVDIYATKNLRELVYAMSKTILNALKSRGQKAFELFLKHVSSIRTRFTFDPMGNMTLSLQLGDIQDSQTTLEEIFKYLEAADKPCIVALDEFQQIAYYPEKNIEALLRTYVQHCNNTHFIFAGSQRHIMTQMFFSAAKPFFQSTSPLHLDTIDLQKYTEFATNHFKCGGKNIGSEVVSQIYERFEGITWYLQKMLNVLYFMTPPDGTCDEDMISMALENILNSMQYNFAETMFRLPEKQKELLVAISREGKAKNISSAEFVKKYGLPSSSSVQSAATGLLEKDFISVDDNGYCLCDKFFAVWLNERF